MTSTDRPGAEMDNENVLHESSDIDVRTVLAFGVGMVAMVAVSFVLMWLMFRVLAHQAAARDPQLSPLAKPGCAFADIERCRDQLPPEPRLQTNEHEALEKRRMMETKSLESYGWVGLPVRADAPPDPRLGTPAHAQGESSGGRTLGLPAPPAGSQPQPAAAPPAAGEPHGGHVIK